MADPALTAVRLLMRTLPGPAREPLAARFFTGVRHYPEPERELELRRRGSELLVGNCHATEFGSGDAVLLIHGWSGRGLQLGAFIDPLIEAGHQVVAMDGPQHGRNEGSRSNMPRWRDALRQAIKQLQPVAIVGHSFGAGSSILAADMEGWSGRLLCLGGPGDTFAIVDRFRNYVRAPKRGKKRFIKILQDWTDVDPADLDVAEAAMNGNATLHCIVSTDDNDVPWSESVRIIENAGGTSTVLEGVGHNQLMWDRRAVQPGLDFVLGAPG